jgi:tungstate transport system substrate-binding protein
VLVPRRLSFVLALALLLGPGPAGAAPGSTTVILSTTTSVQDSGLLDVLLPVFERRTGLSVKPVAVGTGQALALGARGEADVVLAHAPALERRYVEEGRLLPRRLVMTSDFVLVGPAGDPARIQGERDAAAALARIAAAGARFVSRGDRSGTHLLELALWEATGVRPGAPWYIESGQGMGATLGIAEDRQAYTLADRGTLLALGRRVGLQVVVEGDRRLLNLYSVLEVPPSGGPRVNAAGGRALAEFLLSPEAQALIGAFGVERYGRPLFVPAAGKREADPR